MASTDHLARFVHDGLRQGHAPDDLAAALRGAGWSGSEIEAALAAWLPAPEGLAALPVPRPRPYVSARDAVIYGLLFIALATVVWATGSLGWGIINRIIPDIGSYYAAYEGSMRWEMALLVVFGPVFIWLSRRVARASQSDSGRARSLVRKWLASVATILAAITLLGDLVAAVYVFLDGDLTARFAAKAVWVAVLALLVLLYLREDVDVA